MSGPVWRSAFGTRSATGMFPAAMGESATVEEVHLGHAAKAPVVFSGDGTAFVADQSGVVSAITPDLNIRWTTLLPGGITAAPCVTDDDVSVVVGTHEGWVVALDTTDGSIQWKTWLDSDSDPRIQSDLLMTPNGFIVCSSWGGRFVALNAANGEPVHSWSAGVFPRSPAALSGDVVYTGSVEWTDTRKALVFAATDSTTWKTHEFHVQHTSAESPRDAGMYAPPLPSPSSTILFCNRKEECLITLLPKTEATPQQVMPFPVPVYSTAAIHERGFSFAAMNGYVYSFKPNGRMNFAYKTEAEYLLSSPVCDQTSTYIGDPLGRIHRIDATGAGRILVERRRGFEGRLSFSPDGRLYAPCSDAYLVVVSG